MVWLRAHAKPGIIKLPIVVLNLLPACNEVYLLMNNGEMERWQKNGGINGTALRAAFTKCRSNIL